MSQVAICKLRHGLFRDLQIAPSGQLTMRHIFVALFHFFRAAFHSCFLLNDQNLCIRALFLDADWLKLVVICMKWCNLIG
jgi:hypothetical protein